MLDHVFPGDFDCKQIHSGLNMDRKATLRAVWQSVMSVTWSDRNKSNTSTRFLRRLARQHAAWSALHSKPLDNSLDVGHEFFRSLVLRVMDVD